MSLRRADRSDRRHLIIPMLLFIFLIVPSIAFAQDSDADKKIVRLGVYQNQPKLFIDDEGEARGLFIDLFNEIAKKEDWRPVYVTCRWSECLQALEEGRIDLMPDVAYSRRRDARYDFHRLPVAESWSRIYTAPGRSINVLSELNGKSIALLRGSIQQSEFALMMSGFDFDVTMIPTSSYKEAFRMAQNGEVDAAVANHFFGDYFHREYNLNKTPIVFQMSALYYATAEGRNHDLLMAIDANLETWRREPNSVYYLALSRWMEKPPERFIPEYITWIIGIILILLVTAGGMIMVLRQQVRKRTRHLWWANEQLKKSEEQYRHLFESMAQGVLYLAAEGSILTANPAAERIFGMSSEEIIGRNPTSPRWHYLHENGTEFTVDENPVTLALRTGKPIIGTLMGVFHSGENQHRWILVDAVPEFRPGKREPYRIYTTFSDVTERLQAERALEERTAELNKALIGTISVMSLTVEKRDPYTAGHQIRVANLAQKIAEHLGLPDEKVQGIYLAGIIHDIGKISIPAELLSKSDALSDEEYSLIRQHPQVGYDILKPIHFPWPIAQIVLQHHERMDGSGYPHGIIGKDILLETRIIAVADVVETMCLRRPYRPALGLDAALDEIMQNKGVLYDEQVVDACLHLFNNGEYQLFEQ